MTGFLSSTMGVLGLYLVWTRVYNLKLNLGSTYLWSAALSMFILTMILRLSDEIKDREADKIHFPERCLPSKQVFYRDIFYLLIFLLIVFVLMNIFWGGNIILLAGLLLYVFLFYKYFFMPRILPDIIIDFTNFIKCNIWSSHIFFLIQPFQCGMNTFSHKCFNTFAALSHSI